MFQSPFNLKRRLWASNLLNLQSGAQPKCGGVPSAKPVPSQSSGKGPAPASATVKHMVAYAEKPVKRTPEGGAKLNLAIVFDHAAEVPVPPASLLNATDSPAAQMEVAKETRFVEGGPHTSGEGRAILLGRRN